MAGIAALLAWVLGLTLMIGENELVRTNQGGGSAAGSGSAMTEDYCRSNSAFRSSSSKVALAAMTAWKSSFASE